MVFTVLATTANHTPAHSLATHSFFKTPLRVLSLGFIPPRCRMNSVLKSHFPEATYLSLRVTLPQPNYVVVVVVSFVLCAGAPFQ